MSLPWATATIPLATAAADPPLDPPAERCRSHGFRVGQNADGSVVGDSVSSGTLVRPSTISPAARYRRVSSVSIGEVHGWSLRNCMPCW